MPEEETTADAVELDQRSLTGDDMPGSPSGLTCPDCGGALWETCQDHLLQYRCHVGHAFLAEVLLESQAEEIERSLWTLLRILKERMALAHHLANAERQQDSSVGAIRHFEAQAEQARRRAEMIRQVLLLGEVNPLSEPDMPKQTVDEQQDF